MLVLEFYCNCWTEKLTPSYIDFPLLKHSYIQDFMTFGFVFQGAMSLPILTVQISPILNIYKLPNS